MKKKYKILIHIVYWIYIINQGLFPFYINKLDSANLENYIYFKDVFINTVLNIFSFYTIYFSFRQLLKIRLKPLNILAVILLILLITSIRVPLNFGFWKYIGHLPKKDLVFNSDWVWNEFRLVIITGIYAVLIRFMIDWFDSQKLKDELINQQQSSELALLRSQVNPHFLFNTLNNIYSLVYKKSDEAPAAVMKLSRIMRYMLYDSNSNVVQLEKEVDYLKSFIELQELRINQTDYVDFQIEGDNENQTIAPMLLIPFVENAFKHGGKNHTPGIIISLKSINGKITFEVTNFKKKNLLVQNDEIGGIGLQNIKRRLELLYPGKHELQILDEEDKFYIKLEVQTTN
ncbi:MAG: histidine kinase [Bacteroidetes bacterium]|nr:histidine kinase [Bacteroidota bacterium]